MCDHLELFFPIFLQILPATNSGTFFLKDHGHIVKDHEGSFYVRITGGGYRAFCV